MIQSIIALITTLLPIILKIVMYIIEKKQDNDKLKEEFLRFISLIEKDVPVKLHDRYNEQLERLRKEVDNAS
ncbi:MAG: hypothetical protein ACP5N7_01075 [Candidatus Pacearchaeota archaeon]